MTRAQSRKHRGMRTQALIAERWRDNELFPNAADAGAGRQGEDVLNTPLVWVEVKARDRVSLHNAVHKARLDALEAAFRRSEAGDGGDPQTVAAERYWDDDNRYPYADLAIVIRRHNGQGEKSVGEFTVSMSLADFEALWRAANASN